MDNKQSALLWQLVQSMGANAPAAHHPDEHNLQPEPPLDNALLSLRPLMSPKQQCIIDLMVKMQEMRELIDDIHAYG